jgi:hypothetical protein
MHLFCSLIDSRNLLKFLFLVLVILIHVILTCMFFTLHLILRIIAQLSLINHYSFWSIIKLCFIIYFLVVLRTTSINERSFSGSFLIFINFEHIKMHLFFINNFIFYFILFLKIIFSCYPYIVFLLLGQSSSLTCH